MGDIISKDMPARGMNDPFLLPVLGVMILFYAIYFVKMFAQKRRGIQTRQLGKGKNREARAVERALSFATFAVVPAQLVSLIFGWNLAPAPLRMAGVLFGFGGDAIFLTAVITMRDSWRAGIPSEEKTELITDGIYSYSRNPAFLGFDLMYIGILLAYFNLVLLPLTILTVVTLHLQILQEESFLRSAFGGEYMEYKKHTSRYLGRRR